MVRRERKPVSMKVSHVHPYPLFAVDNMLLPLGKRSRNMVVNGEPVIAMHGMKALAK